MIVTSDIQKLKLSSSVIALGKFDGVHLGHQQILAQLQESEAENKVILTFSVSPESVLTGKKGKYLMTEEEKQHFFETSGIDYLIDIKLEKNFLQMEAHAFVRDILVSRLGVRKIVCGRDFRFGKNRGGNVELLQELGKKYDYETGVVEKLRYDGEIISSTSIRGAVERGALEKANAMLGRAYRIEGMVQHGKQLGRTLNFPTMNLYPQPEKLLPPYGVYKSRAMIDGTSYDGITNIGINPTVEDAKKEKVETHLFAYEGSAYGAQIEVELLEFMRAEKRFSSVEELKNQISHDVERAKKR